MPAKLISTPAFRRSASIAPIEGIRDTLRQLSEREHRIRTSTICTIFAVTKRRLQWMDEQRVITPEHVGHVRLYTIDQALLVGIITKLRARGMSLQSIRPVLRKVRHALDSSPRYVLVSPDGGTLACDDPESVVAELARSTKYAHLIVVDDIARLIAQGIGR
jgi:DNA-binding transcriptional MerR regulator